MSQVIRVIAGCVGTHVLRLGPLRVPEAEKGAADPLLPESSKAGRSDGAAVARIGDGSVLMFDQLVQTSN